MMTGAFNQNVSKLFYELKLVTNNLLFTNIVSTNFSTLVLLQSLTWTLYTMIVQYSNTISDIIITS